MKLCQVVSFAEPDQLLRMARAAEGAVSFAEPDRLLGIARAAGEAG